MKNTHGPGRQTQAILAESSVVRTTRPRSMGPRPITGCHDAAGRHEARGLLASKVPQAHRRRSVSDLERDRSHLPVPHDRQASSGIRHVNEFPR